MKKKVLSLMLAGAMVLSMAACGSQNTDQGAANDTSAKAPRQLRRILIQRSLKAHRLRYLQQQVWRML